MNRNIHLDEDGRVTFNLQGEEWRQVPDYVMYWASTAGRVRKLRAKDTKLVRQTVNPQGVPIVRITSGGSQKTIAVKHIIASTWKKHGSLGSNVKHLNGDKLDCRSCNLEYYSYYEERTVTAATKAEIARYVKTATKDQLLAICAFIGK